MHAEVSATTRLTCRLPQRDTMVKRGEWFFDGFHPGLWGRMAGVIGLGRIGYAMARRCHAAEMHIMVCDPWASDELLARGGVYGVSLDIENYCTVSLFLYILGL